MSTVIFRNALASLFLSGVFLITAASGKAKTVRSPLASVIEDSIPNLGIIAATPDQLLRNAMARLKARDTIGLMLMSPDPELLIAIYKKTPEGKKANEGQVNFLREFYYMDNGKLLYRSLGNYGGQNIEMISWKSLSPPIVMGGGRKILQNIEIRVKNWTTQSEDRINFVSSIYVDPKGCKIWGFRDKKAR